MWHISANRDERHFDDPFRFDIGRDAQRSRRVRRRRAALLPRRQPRPHGDAPDVRGDGERGCPTSASPANRTTCGRTSSAASSTCRSRSRRHRRPTPNRWPASAPPPRATPSATDTRAEFDAHSFARFAALSVRSSSVGARFARRLRGSDQRSRIRTGSWCGLRPEDDEREARPPFGRPRSVRVSCGQAVRCLRLASRPIDSSTRNGGHTMPAE